MPTLIRRDDWITDSMGNVVTGVNVYVCTQPSNTHITPPSPLAAIYSDPLNADPITQPLCSDGAGHVEFYCAPSIVTIVYTSPQIQQVVLVDQCIVQPDGALAPQYQSDSTANGTLGSAGFGGIYTTSATPSPVTSLIVTVNGIVQTGWSFSAPRTLELAAVPQSTDVVAAVYQVNAA
jgi:hypothetical protein